MKNKRHLALVVVLVVATAVAAIVLLPRHRRGRRVQGYLPMTLTVEAAEVSTWTEAVRKVKEDRGESTGKQARVEIPGELRHYGDSRRFLAIQVAEWREHKLRTPSDFVELAEMIRSREMVPVKAVTTNHILFGVGGSANSAPFTRYENGDRVELYDQAGLDAAYAKIESTRAALASEIVNLRKEINSLGRRQRSKRSSLQTRLNEKEKAATAANHEKKTLDRYYGDSARRTALINEYNTLMEFGKTFDDQSYDIKDARQRRDLKRRMLAFLRPEALKVLNEIADSYHDKFGRPLPITSLVRPDEYQYALSKTNPNATRIDTPPHSTGLAFDILYRYMTAEEQAHVMSHLAELKDAGRIEVLRENRDHYHVFAFIDGARPNEKFIGASLPGIGAARKAVQESARMGKAQKATKKKAVARKKSRRGTRR
jgi:DNA-binding transcriptional ArsR family regulator